MDKQFFQDFLMLSQAHTIATLAILCVVFYALKKNAGYKNQFFSSHAICAFNGFGVWFYFAIFGKFSRC